MFDRFENRAKEVMAAAQEEARALRHNHISVEHMVLGILNEPEEDVAGTTLVEMGLTLPALRSYMQKNFPPKEPSTAAAPLPFSSSCKKSLELALREALGLGAKTIRTEHILLGIIRDPDKNVAKIMDEFNIEIPKLREALLTKLNQAGGRGRDAVAAGPGPGTKRKPGKHLANYARNLTEMARQGKLDPVIGRKTEIHRLLQILTRRTKNNPVLVGYSGVGKTSIIEGVAQQLANGDVPARLEGREIYALDLAGLVAGTKYRGEFEERLKNIIKEVSEDKSVILFIDEIHTLVSAGAAEGALDAANILKPVLARGDMCVIGATTFEEYKKYFEKDTALERRFQQVTVDPPSNEDTLKILQGLVDTYEQHHTVHFEPEALAVAVELADKYIPDRHMPDKAIDLMDEAASYVYMADASNGELRKINEAIKEMHEKKDHAIENEQFEEAQNFSNKEKEFKQQRQALAAIDEKDEATWPVVTAEDVAKVVGMWTGIQVSRLTAEETDRLRNMEAELHKRVISQELAIAAISRSIRRSKAGLHDNTQPLGSFLFLGPSGVGKTELAKTLAEFLFTDEKSMIRLDMSEYTEKHNVSRLVGSPPGYVGYDEGGQLTDKVRRKPYSVVLFDEIEKAHPDVWNILLQVLDEGELTDGQGRIVNFRNTVIIMTSNLGAEMISKSTHGIGFANAADDEGSYTAMRDKVLEKYNKEFPPELRNRIDEVVVFEKLTKTDIAQIIDLMLARLEKLLADKGLKLELTQPARELIMEEGYDQAMGARPLRRAIRRFVEEPLADQMLGILKEGSVVRVNVDPENEKKTQIEVLLPKPKRKQAKKKPENDLATS